MKQYLIATGKNWDIYKSETETKALIKYIKDRDELKNFTIDELEKFVDNFGIKKLIEMYNSSSYEELLYIAEVNEMYENKNDLMPYHRELKQ